MRRGWIIAASVVLVLGALLIVAIVLVQRALSPERFTDLVRSQAAAVGLRITLQDPAQPTLWPHLAVRLRGLQVRRQGHDEPMLGAREVLLVVPWASIFNGTAQINKLRLQAPRIDVAQVQAWLGDLQDEGTAGKPQLPRIATGVHVGNGTVTRGNTLLLKSLALETGTLAPGQPFDLDLQALDAEGQPLHLHLHTLPTETPTQVTLDPLELRLAAGSRPALKLAGQLRWQGGSRLQTSLDGTLTLAAGDYAVSLRWPDPATVDADGNSRAARVLLTGATARMDIALEPSRMLAWWQQMESRGGPALTLPPFVGTVKAEKLEFGSLLMEGLEVHSSLPAPATSQAAEPTPAAAASAP